MSENKVQYKVLHKDAKGGVGSKREGELDTGKMPVRAILEQIFEREQNEITPRQAPSASAGDIIVLGVYPDARRFRIDDEGFTEVSFDDALEYMTSGDKQ